MAKKAERPIVPPLGTAPSEGGGFRSKGEPVVEPLAPEVVEEGPKRVVSAETVAAEAAGEETPTKKEKDMEQFDALCEALEDALDSQGIEYTRRLRPQEEPPSAEYHCNVDENEYVITFQPTKMRKEPG
jgi:hypothetical protein